MRRCQGLLFGLNYKGDKQAELYGCINDVKNISKFLNSLNIPTQCLTDDITPQHTTASGIINKLYEATIDSYRNNLDLLWIHYSGHGSYIRDISGDEKDRRDECIVPTDFRTAGLITDDLLNNILSRMNPRTRVVCIFDSCHSGTVVDIKWSWETPFKSTVENEKCKIPCKMISISGARDNQVAADAYDVLGDKQFSGAMTSCLLLALQNKANRLNVFNLVNEVKRLLKQRGFLQVPVLCSTYNLTRDLPILLK